MKFSSSIATVPLVLSGLTAVYAESTSTETVVVQVDQTETVLASESHGSKHSSHGHHEHNEKNLWDSVSGLFYDNGVFNLEAIETELEVCISYFKTIWSLVLFVVF